MTATTAPRSSDPDLLQQVRDVVERSLADPEYARAIRELALAGDPDEALPVLPPGVADGLAGIELTLHLNPFATKVSPVDRRYLDGLPEALRSFVSRTQVDAEFAESARVTA